MPLRTKIIIGVGVAVFAALCVTVFVNRDLPTHRVLKAALHLRGCDDEPTLTRLPSSPPGFTGWNRKADTAWRVEGCGAAHDAVVHEHRERTGRKGRHHVDVYEVVFWAPAR